MDTLIDGIEAGTGGLSVGSDGTIYTADFGAVLNDPSTAGTRVFAITPDGVARVFAEHFAGASGNSFDSHGNLFQSNIRGNTISRITPDGRVQEFATEGFQSPVGIEIDPDDNLYVANCGSNSIQLVTPQGQSSRFIEDALLSCPNGITRDEVGNFYVANFNNGDVIKITPAAEVSRLATLPGNNNGHLIYHDGGLYVVARGAHQIYRVELDGQFAVFAGSGESGADDGDAAVATFSYPNDIGVSPDGHLFYVNEPSPLGVPHTVLSPTRTRRIVLVEPAARETR